MEVTSTIEINGEEREIADAYAREQCAGLNNNLSVIGKCKNLLNPTLATTTENGVTCTNNGDGTFTLNGTATAITQFKLMDLNKAYAKKVKLLGTPKNGGNTNFYVYFITSDGIRSDLNNGRFIDSNITINNLCLWVNNGIVCKNVIFKPMLTTNLNATYDDFVPYTGDGETLTADVAELKSDLSAVQSNTILNYESTTVDLDSLTGHPLIASVNTGVTNAPTGFGGGYMIVVYAGSSSAALYQTLVDVVNNKTYRRSLYHGSWSDWTAQ